MIGLSSMYSFTELLMDRIKEQDRASLPDAEMRRKIRPEMVANILKEIHKCCPAGEALI